MKGLLQSIVLMFGFLLLAAGCVDAQGVLVDKSEIRFVSKQMGVNFEGRFRKWKANILFQPKDLAKSKAEFDIDLTSIDLASDDSENEVKDRMWFDMAKFPTARLFRHRSRIVAPTSMTSWGSFRSKASPRTSWCRSR